MTLLILDPPAILLPCQGGPRCPVAALCVSRPENHENLHEGCVIGRVTTALEGHQPEGHWYLCGNGAMIEEVRGLLKTAGLDRKQIHVEKYY